MQVKEPKPSLINKAIDGFVGFVRKHPKGTAITAALGLSHGGAFWAGSSHGEKAELWRNVTGRLSSEMAIYTSERPKGISYEVWRVMHASTKTLSEDGKSIIFTHSGTLYDSAKEKIKSELSAEAVEKEVSPEEIKKRKEYSLSYGLVHEYEGKNQYTFIVDIEKLRQLNIGVVTTNVQAPGPSR